MKPVAMKPVLAVAALLLVLAGCSATRSLFPENADTYFTRGKALVDKGMIEAGLADVERALKADPRNTEYRVYLTRRRSQALNEWLTGADAALKKSDAESAAVLFGRVLQLDPGNDRARAGLDDLRRSGRHEALVREAAGHVVAGRPDEALARLRTQNAAVRRVRCRIEKVFGTWKRSCGLRRMRWRGLAKAGLQVRLAAIA
jgi:tetratricopeptide (TPR) repeat protein